MFAIRTHAVAVLAVALGHKPAGVDFAGTAPLYIFEDSAKPVLKQYADARQALADAVAETEAAR